MLLQHLALSWVTDEASLLLSYVCWADVLVINYLVSGGCFSGR